MAVGVLRLSKYGSRAHLEALAKLCGREEGCDDDALHLKARRRMQKVLEKAHEAGKTTDEEVFDGIMTLGGAHVWFREWDKSKACFESAREGFVRLLGEGSAKPVVPVYMVAAAHILSVDERLVELRQLWEMTKVSLPDGAVTRSTAQASWGVSLRKRDSSRR